MLPFFLTIGIISGLIIGGVSLSCYLNKQGVFGKQRLISAQRYRAFEDEYVVEEESGDQLAMSAVEEAESSRYARKGLLVCPGGLAVVVMLMSTLVSVLLH
jgi:hypothetical protein